MRLERKIVKEFLTGEQIEIVRCPPNGRWYHINGFNEDFVNSVKPAPLSELPSYMIPKRGEI